MVSTILANLIAFAKSMPTNMIIIVIICVIMKVCGKKVSDCVRFVLIYLLIGLLLGIIGIAMPDFMTIGRWIVGILKSLW